MICELISVGTEILMGNIVNTNAQYLSAELTRAGVRVYYQSVVGDNPERMEDAIRTAMNRAELVILTGGLGPTQDDITRETTAKVLGMELKMDERIHERIDAYFERTGRKPAENNWRQAMVPEGALVMDNDNGTAPGLILTADQRAEGIAQGHTAILLPGPPGELIPMFQMKALPYIKRMQPGILVSDMVKICGVGESRAESMVMDLIQNQTNPTIASYAKTGEVHFRITASAETAAEARAALRPVVREFMQRFGNCVYTTKEEDSLEEVVARELMRRDLTLTAAESCTGGLVMGRLVNVSGASDVFKEGFVTYSNKAKHRLLGVKKSTLEKFGAVSEETACEMAFGALDRAKADVAVAVTGIAGPSGGTGEKPVGLVYIACAMDGEVIVERNVFNGDRAKVREQSVIRALDLVRRVITEK